MSFDDGNPCTVAVRNARNEVPPSANSRSCADFSGQVSCALKELTTVDGLGSAHLALVAFWGGLVAVESAIEALGERGHVPIDAVARIHQVTDRFIEIPTLMGIVATGLLLWARTGWAPELALKVGVGLGAVVANLVTAVYVERRARGIGDARRATIMIFGFGAMVFPLGFIALYLGGRLVGWFSL
jgi:hypothetical protein